MKKSIIFIILSLIMVMSIGSVFCYNYAPWQDPARTTFYLADGTQVTEQEFDAAILEEAMKYATNGTKVYNPGGQATASTPNAQTSAADSSKSNAAPKKKFTVSFTDMFGHVIGVSQVTEGTDIAQSQFPAAVEDIEAEGQTFVFDRWDYDGEVVLHDLVVRALYK